MDKSAFCATKALPNRFFSQNELQKISEKENLSIMDNGRNAISMPARPEDLYASASSDESFGSDDVFQSFNEEGNEAMFLRLGMQKFRLNHF